MSTGSDAQSRRNILQGLQQTRSRLQKQHSEDPQRTGSATHSRGAVSGGHTAKQPSNFGAHQQLAPPTRTPHLSPSPTPSTTDNSILAQQQKMAMQQVTAQSFGYFVPQPSTHSNLVLPVLPRFDNSGQLS